MAVANFTPSSAGIYEFELSVSDGEASAARDNITITVVAPNTSPVADAGSDQSVETDQVVTLDGSGSSEPDGDVMQYAWVQVAGPAVALTNSTSIYAVFTPTVPGTYIFRLTVGDEDFNATDDVSVVVSEVHVPSDGTPQLEVEPNNDTTSANEISLGNRVPWSHRSEQ